MTIIDERPGGHPEQARANARKAILNRSDTDWAHYGFSSAEKDAWTRAGIPEDRAYLAAICRSASKYGAEITPRSLGVKLRDLKAQPSVRRPKTQPETLLERLLSGMNTFRLVERVAGHRGWVNKIDPVLGLAVGEGVYPISFETGDQVMSRMLELQDPHLLPAVLDAVVSLGAREQRAAQPRIALNKQVNEFLAGAPAGPLLTRAGELFGVYDDEQLLSELAPHLAPHATSPEKVAAAFDVYAALTRDRSLYFADAGMSQLIHGASVDEVTTVPVSASDLPAANGLLWLSSFKTPEEEAADLPGVGSQMLAWATGRDGTLTVTTIAAKKLRERMTASNVLKLSPHAVATTRMSEFGIDDHVVIDDRFDQEHRSLSLFLSFVHLVKQVRDGEMPAAPAEPTSGGPTVKEPERPIGISPDRRDAVIVLRARDDGSEETPGAPVARTVQWTVRGHWRKQWYPSRKTHGIIWIDEHRAGSADGPLISRDRVTVIRR